MPNLKLMSTARQQEIVEAVKTAVDLHNGGESPSGAIAKVATDLKMNEHEAKLMVDAFNTSKTLAHMRSTDGQEKAASFDLADYDEVIKLAFPKDQPKTALARDYQFDRQIPSYHRTPKVASQTEKRAYQVIEDSNGQATPISQVGQTFDDAGVADLRSRKAYEAIDYWRKKAEAARQDLDGLKFQLTDTVGQLISHFKEAAHASHWPTFVKEAEQLHGAPAVHLLEAAADSLGMTSIFRRHGSKVAAVTLADPESHQHKLLKVALLASELAIDAATRESQARAKHAEELEAWRRLGKAEAAGQHKQADLATIATLGMVNRSLNNALDNKATSQPSSNIDISPDVGLESEYGKAKLQLALRDMLDRDEVLAQHAEENPNSIFEAAQALADLQPNILNQPITLQAALRRHLELGQTEPHELEQVRRLAAPTTPIAHQAAMMNPGGI